MSHYNKFWTNHTDKFLHFFAGFVIYLFAVGITKIVVTAFSIVLAVAIAKELYDYLIKRSRFDFWDIVATMLGAGVAQLSMVLLEKLTYG